MAQQTPKINSTKLLGGSSFATKKVSTSALQSENIVVPKKDLVVIKTQVIKIKNLITSSTLLKQAENERKRKGTEKQKFKKEENKLETKKEPGTEKIKVPGVPKLGFLDRLKNLIFTVLLGRFIVKMLPNLPKLIGVVKAIGSGIEFATDFAGGILNGLATFIDWGYKAIDGTRGFLKNIGGEGLAKDFDKFSGVMSNLLDVAVIAALATADSGGSGGGGDLSDMGGDFVRDKLLKKGAQQGAQTVAGEAAGTAGEAAGLGGAAVAGIVAGAGLLASALGEGAFQLRKVATKPMQDAKKAFDNEKNPFMKIGRGVFLGGMNTLLGPISAIGVLLDVIGAPFRYAIELLRFPFLSEEDKKKQAYNLAKMDARIREDFRKALNIVTLGFAFKEKGSFGNIYGDTGAQKEMMGKMAGGGQTPTTRGGKLVGGPAKRTIKKTIKRGITTQPTKLKPGADIGGQKNIEKIFPKPEGKDKDKQVNSFAYVENSYDTIKKAPFFGPVLSLTNKALVGQKPTQLDYNAAAQGLNAWMNTTFNSEVLGGAFASGGEVNSSMFLRGEDMTNVIAKSLQDNVSSQIDSAIQDLMKQLGLKEIEKKKTPGADDGGAGGTGGQYSPEGLQGEIYQYLLSKGMDDTHALGIMANIKRESGFSPGVSESGGPGVGLFQYSDDTRKPAFLKAVSDYKTNWKGQIDYALKETGAPGQQYLSMKFNSSQDAADWWMKNWERPAEYIQNVSGPKIHKDYLASVEKYKTKTGYNIPTTADLGNAAGGANFANGQVQYLTGDPSQGSNYRTDHGGGNYHDHLGFKDHVTALKAFDFFKSKNFEVTEMKGKTGLGPSHQAPSDPHQQGVAFDVPGSQWPVGQEPKGSAKVRATLSQFLSKPMFGGGSTGRGGIVRTHPGEYIIDKDSVDAFGIDFFDIINQTESVAQRKQSSKQLMSILQFYAGYEAGGRQKIKVKIPAPQVSYIPVPVPVGGGGMIMSGHSPSDSDYDSTYG